MFSSNRRPIVSFEKRINKMKNTQQINKNAFKVFFCWSEDGKKNDALLLSLLENYFVYLNETPFFCKENKDVLSK